jgi:hypothetical protein
VGRISHSQWTFHVAAITSDRILATFRSGLMVHSPTVVSRSSFRHSSPIAGSGLLAITDAMGSSTRRVGVTALWKAFMDDTTSTYFHATHSKTNLCKTRLRMYTCLFHIPNTSIYMFFRAQDHNMAVGWDMTSSMPS